MNAFGSVDGGKWGYINKAGKYVWRPGQAYEPEGGK
jgi:hypothetical protein